MKIRLSFKLFFFLFGLFLLISCKSESKSDVATEYKTSYEVNFFGKLKDIMHKGDVSAKVELGMLDKKHLYALGAFENLKGEIQIFNGASYSTYVEDSLLKFDKTFDKNATLLIYANVSVWQEIQIPENISSYENLEKFIEKKAKEQRIDVEKPFPFLIGGTAKSFDWHTIDWQDGDTKHSHQKHVNSGLHGTVESADVELLGFYSNKHHAIFTHHTTNMHIHVRTLEGDLAGHLDDLVLGQKMVLKLPK